MTCCVGFNRRCCGRPEGYAVDAFRKIVLTDTGADRKVEKRRPVGVEASAASARIGFIEHTNVDAKIGRRAFTNPSAQVVVRLFASTRLNQIVAFETAPGVKLERVTTSVNETALTEGAANKAASVEYDFFVGENLAGHLHFLPPFADTQCFLRGSA